MINVPGGPWILPQCFSIVFCTAQIVPLAGCFKTRNNCNVIKKEKNMDLEIDFSDDKIESFLTTKLEEIRFHNKALETRLHDSKHINTNSTSEDGGNIHVNDDECWKKIFDNKYVLGYFLECKKPIECSHISVYLTWDTEDVLEYKCEIFSLQASSQEPCSSSSDCKLELYNLEWNPDLVSENAFIVVVLNAPQYLSKLEYILSGYISYKKAGRASSACLPKVYISANDSIISNSWLKENYISNILSLMSCLNSSRMVLILPEEWTASIMSTFEIHCGFSFIKTTNTCKLYFLADNVSKMFDNMLIVVHPDKENSSRIFLNIFSSSNEQLFTMCHHLGNSLKNTVLFPFSYYNSYLCKNASFSNELLEEFGKSLKQELQTTYKLSQGLSKSYDSSRFRLSTVEKKTDIKFHQVSNMKY